VAGGLIEEGDVIKACAGAPPGAILVLTGRGATPGLIALADTATEMQCVKHAFDHGQKAQAGVEF
jgi:cob(I)alamin adenosyltransferase